MTPTNPFDELRISIERLGALLESLVVRGLRACGPDQLTQLQAFVEQLEQAGAGHVAGDLSDLHARIEKDDRAAPRALLKAQTSVRLLERLLTLRIVHAQYKVAIAAMDAQAAGGAGDSGDSGDSGGGGDA